MVKYETLGFFVHTARVATTLPFMNQNKQLGVAMFQ